MDSYELMGNFCNFLDESILSSMFKKTDFKDQPLDIVQIFDRELARKVLIVSLVIMDTYLILVIFV